MMAHFKKQVISFFEGNMTKKYLILASVLLVSFAIWFSNVGFLPFKNVGDFVFFAFLSFILGLYRPGWTFVFFVGALALENINLAPSALGISLRPYQFFALITITALIVRFFSKKLPFSLPKFKWVDFLPLVFVVGSFLSALGAVDKGASLKQSVIAISFVALYFLSRVFVQSLDDLKRVVPFFLSTGIVVAAYGIWQNAAFVAGRNSFEIMPGRPNGTFVEADWLGVYLVFLLAALFTLVYKKSKNKFGIVGCWLVIFISFVALVLTVSRSAWIGGLVVVLGYLKLVLLYGRREEIFFGIGKNKFWKELKTTIFAAWHWREFFWEGLKILGVVAASVLIVYIFGLTRFQISDRAESSGGLQKITIACQGEVVVPEKISNVEELSDWGCRHINLEEIEKEKSQGLIIREVFRPDPNVSIRARIYQTVFDELKNRPLNGIGWGSISLILGNDSRGAGLNASNIFLETWLGSGIVGLLSFVTLLGFVFVLSVFKFVKAEQNIGLVFVLLGLFAIIVPNLFNSGIFLGFVWVFLGIAVGLILEKNNA